MMLGWLNLKYEELAGCNVANWVGVYLLYRPNGILTHTDLTFSVH